MQVFFPRWVKATTAASRLKSTMLQISEQPAAHSWWIEKDKKQVTAVSKPTHWKWNRACSLVTRPRTWRSLSTSHVAVQVSSAISATPATQRECGCHQVPRLPRNWSADVTKCHACHAKCHSVTGDQWDPSAPPDPAQCHKCHACHTKRKSMWASATLYVKDCVCVSKIVCDKVACQRLCVLKIVCNKAVVKDCVRQSCVCVKDCVRQSCVTKLLCERLCVWQSCYVKDCVCDKVVYDKVVCERLCVCWRLCVTKLLSKIVCDKVVCVCQRLCATKLCDKVVVWKIVCVCDKVVMWKIVCVTKLCMTKLCVKDCVCVCWRLCVTKLLSKIVCDKVVCVCQRLCATKLCDKVVVWKIVCV